MPSSSKPRLKYLYRIEGNVKEARRFRSLERLAHRLGESKTTELLNRIIDDRAKAEGVYDDPPPGPAESCPCCGHHPPRPLRT